MHDVIVVGVPLLAILAGIFFNRNDIKDLRGEMHGLRAEMNAGFDKVDARFNKIEERLVGIDADLRQFYHLTGKLEGRVDAIEKRF
ncbi:MAG TPA: hypothetical protein VH250_07590 [Granulicella sp.]|jgi:hypothetical protein|nr:hypothetical protein [Granulicella sp.]